MRVEALDCNEGLKKMPAIGAGILAQVKEKARSAFGSGPCLAMGYKKDIFGSFAYEFELLQF